MESTEAEQHRVALLNRLAEQTEHKTNAYVNLREVGPTLGLTLEQIVAAHRWLRDHGLVGDAATGMQCVHLTDEGLERARQIARHPDEQSPGMAAPTSVTYNIGSVHSLQHGTTDSTQHATSVLKAPPADGFLRGVSVQAVGGTVAGIALVFIAALFTDWFGLGSGDSSSPGTETTPTTNRSVSSRTCRGS
ncbi:MAG: hypothetical protein ABIX10_08090 [Acidimicrobiales bacterium]